MIIKPAAAEAASSVCSYKPRHLTSLSASEGQFTARGETEATPQLLTP